jgi:hypothetical protein
MRDASEILSITSAAERAGVAGDWPAAERLLREAVVAQEAALGPAHPDLAYTLNNLGVACERNGNTRDAEQCYRRAYAIASAALPATDPLVMASGENLREFCEALGVPLKQAPPAPPAVTAHRHEPDIREEHQTAIQEPAADVERPRRRIVVSVAVVLIAVALAGVMWLRSGEPQAPTSEAQREPIGSSPTPPPTLEAARPPEPSPAPEPAPPSVQADPPGNRPTANVETPVATTPPPAPAGDAAVSVVTAQLCRAFSNWQCTTAGSPTDATQLFFYTRLRSPADTTIEHRWYYDGRLLRTVPLRIRANQAEGFRTYSRNTISGERTGSWRVELRTQEGTVLYEEQVEVRR